jgi:hypothetical protein
MVGIAYGRPVAGKPRWSELCTPCAVARTATLSPSATMSCTAYRIFSTSVTNRSVAT